MIKSHFRNLAVLIVLGCAAAACTTSEARLSGAAAGAGAGALVGGPIGAIAGGAVGVIAGPSLARTGS
jgi:osmotically inducible lipoprotein OsmB